MADIDADELAKALDLVGEYVPYAGSMSDSEWQAHATALSLAMDAAKAHLATLRGGKSHVQNLREITDELKAIEAMLRAQLSALDSAETEEQAAELRAELWRTVNDYTVACGGRPDKHVGSVVRMKAVAELESIVAAALKAAKERG
jgi:hypothetical protein